eukprot:9356313-Pyramimonas_sp.AAC.1
MRVFAFSLDLSLSPPCAQHGCFGVFPLKWIPFVKSHSRELVSTPDSCPSDFFLLIALLR